MSTITTKQLRENMPQIVRDLKQGKAVQLSYRHKVIGTIQPVQPEPTPLHRGSPEAVLEFLKAADFGPIPDDIKSSKLTIKQEIARLRDKDLNQRDMP